MNFAAVESRGCARSGSVRVRHARTAPIISTRSRRSRMTARRLRPTVSEWAWSRASAIYRERAASAETVNADLKTWRGLDRLLLRGASKVLIVGDLVGAGLQPHALDQNALVVMLPLPANFPIGASYRTSAASPTSDRRLQRSDRQRKIQIFTNSEQSLRSEEFGKDAEGKRQKPRFFGERVLNSIALKIFEFAMKGIQTIRSKCLDGRARHLTLRVEGAQALAEFYRSAVSGCLGLRPAPIHLRAHER